MSLSAAAAVKTGGQPFAEPARFTRSVSVSFFPLSLWGLLTPRSRSPPVRTGRDNPSSGADYRPHSRSFAGIRSHCHWGNPFPHSHSRFPPQGTRYFLSCRSPSSDCRRSSSRNRLPQTRGSQGCFRYRSRTRFRRSQTRSSLTEVTKRYSSYRFTAFLLLR